MLSSLLVLVSKVWSKCAWVHWVLVYVLVVHLSRSAYFIPSSKTCRSRLDYIYGERVNIMGSLGEIWMHRYCWTIYAI